MITIVMSLGFRKLRFQNVSRPYENRGQNGVFNLLQFEERSFEKLLFPNGLEWMEGPTLEIKLRFFSPLQYARSLTYKQR